MRSCPSFFVQTPIILGSLLAASATSGDLDASHLHHRALVIYAKSGNASSAIFPQSKNQTPFPTVEGVTPDFPPFSPNPFF